MLSKLWHVRVDVLVAVVNLTIMASSSILKKRAASIYQEDAGKPIRKSHENPDIIKLYDEFLGKPCGEKSHHLLHTHYFDKSNEVFIEE